MTVADFIIRRLRAAGVRTLFGMPGGGSNLELVEAAGRADLPFVLTSTETAAALAALAQAELTGRPGACLTTLGPGAASVVNGVACASLERAPLVVFTDNHAPAGGQRFEHQSIDQAALFAPVTKWSGALAPETAPATIDRALALAIAAPPGPVHVECPGDVASSEVAEPAAADQRDSSSPHPWTMSGPLEALCRRSMKPLLIVGLGARRVEDVQAIRALCERRGLPALVTYKAKGVLPDDHPLFAGVFTNAQIEQPAIDGSDLLIGVGLDPVELIPRVWARSQPILSCCRWTVRDDHVPFSAQLVTEIPAALAAIEACLPPSAWISADVKRLLDRQRKSIDFPSTGLTAQGAVSVIASRVAPGTRVTVDAGAHMFPATILWPVRDASEMLISNGLSTMGFALPAAVGAALLDPRRPVVALTGDGGLLMCVAELGTARREQLRIVTVVFNDRSLSLIDIKQQAKGYRRAGVDLGAISWPAVAAGFGVRAFCAETEAQLASAVETALACDGPTLVEARIDPANYQRMLAAIRGMPRGRDEPRIPAE